MNFYRGQTSPVMKIALRVEYRDGVEDPEALTVQNSIKKLGVESVKSVKIVKEYLFDVDSKNPRKDIERLAGTLLMNPVIHKYSLVEE